MDGIVARYKEAYKKKSEAFVKELMRNEEPIADQVVAIESYKKISEATIKQLKKCENSAASVGDAIEIYWPLDKEYYPATITAVQPTSGLYSLSYFDGEFEEIHLLKETWRFLEKAQNKSSGCFREANISTEGTNEGEYEVRKASFFDLPNLPPLDSIVVVKEESGTQKGVTMDAIAARYKQECERRNMCVEAYNKKKEVFMKELMRNEKPNAGLLAEIESHKKLTEASILELKECDTEKTFLRFVAKQIRGYLEI